MQEAGHESNACEKPKTTENKQCYSCGGTGHLAAECPSIRVGAAFGAGGPKCYQCGQIGHIARSCPSAEPVIGADGVAATPAPVVRPVVPRGPGFFPRGGFAGRGGFGRGGFAGRGGFVGARGPAGRCYSCGGVGHVAATCPSVAVAAAVRSGTRKCYSCQQEGHIARDCPLAAAPAEGATIA
ncbi:hypothetical protein JCM8547_001691 [Rhodosporidiobolus lusitaniae]